jgi:hypothetical protein
MISEEMLRERSVVGMYESIAVKLRLSPEELERESVRLYLQQKLRLVESQLLSLTREYGVSTVTELDELVRGGRVREDEAFEDFFEFDHLEAERDLLLESLKELD